LRLGAVSLKGDFIEKQGKEDFLSRLSIQLSLNLIFNLNLILGLLQYPLLKQHHIPTVPR